MCVCVCGLLCGSCGLLWQLFLSLARPLRQAMAPPQARCAPLPLPRPSRRRTTCCAKTGPASHLSTVKARETPASATPSWSARCTGAAPRYLQR